MPPETGARSLPQRLGGAAVSELITALRRPAASAAVVAALVAVTVTYARFGLTLPLRTDYLAMLTGASLLAHGGCLYCHGSQLTAQAQLLGVARPAFDPFLELPVVALAYRPLLSLPPAAGYAVFLLLSAASVAGAAAIAARRIAALRAPVGVAVLALAIVSLPAAWNYHLGQVDALLALPLVGGWALLDSGRTLTAGLVLSALLVKPQTVWLVPVALLLAGEWRAVAGMAVGGVAWAGASLLLVGLEGFGQWLSLLGQAGPAVATSVGLPGMIAALFGGDVGVAASAVLGLAACAWLAQSRRALADSSSLALAMGIALSVLLAPHVYPYDLIVLAVPLLVLAERSLTMALACGLMLSGAHLVDTYSVDNGPHLEAAATLAIAGCLGWMLSGRLAAHRRTALPAQPTANTFPDA